MASRRLIVTAIAAVVGAVLLVVLALALANNPEVQNNLGEKVFTVGDAESLAEEVDKRGPLLFQDLLGGDRDILVDHIRGDEWLATPPASAASAGLELDRETGEVRNSCTRRAVDLRSIAAVKAVGAVAYTATVDESGKLVVDLRTPR